MKTIQLQDPNVIEQTIEILEQGGLVIFPTETAYGVGVDATNTEAVSRLLDYKKRPQGKAISIGVSDKSMAEKYVEVNAQAENIYKQFLPGPVTVISKSKGNVDKRLESEAGTLGIRIPNQELILQLINKFGKPITTTSANSSGKKTPYSIDDVLDNLSNKQKDLIDLIIDGGQLPKRLTSTVIDTTTDELKTYRQGETKFQNRNVKSEYKTFSPDETITLGADLMNKYLDQLVEKPIVFLLHGDLGAGKTHFTKGVAKALGIDRTIKSPTYTYIEEYRFQKPEDRNQSSKKVNLVSGVLYHVDAWRIESKDDLEVLNFKDCLKKGNVLVIEWPEIIQNLGFEFNEGEIIDLEFAQGSSADQREIKEREN